MAITTVLDQIRCAETDEQELWAVLAALRERATVHQITSPLGIADEEFSVFLASRATEISTPARLETGDLVVSTQRAATTLIQVTRPYRRPAGAATYSAEVIMPGNRHQQLSGDVLEPWFPVKVVRATTPTTGAGAPLAGRARR